MTTYSAIPDGDIDQDSPITQPLMTALRDNPIAVTEGATGAPRIRVGALQRIVAGTSIRSRKDAVQALSNGSYASVYSFGFLQAGTIRVSFESRRVSASSVDTRVRRTRGETTSTLGSWSSSSATFSTQTLDATVLPGDLLSLEALGASGGSYEVQNIRLQTNGEDLYPGTACSLEGNTFNS